MNDEFEEFDLEETKHEPEKITVPSNDVKDDKSKKKPLSARMLEIESDTAHLSEEKIKEVLEAHSNVIDQWAYVLHDKDLKPDGTLKNPHYHVDTHFRYPCELPDVASWFGLAPNFVKRIQSPRFSSAVAYLTHANAPEKHQYNISEVKANFDVRSTINNELVVKGKKKRRLEIIQGIFDGEITEYNYTDGRLTDVELFEYKRDIQNAFEVVWCKRANALGKRDMRVMLFYGATGAGKTTLAKIYCEKNNLTYAISSTSNDALQDYKGQDVFIFDEFRDSDMKFNDLLKLLDNNTSSTSKSRYRNVILDAKMIIITTSIDPYTLYDGMEDKDSEKQRRQGRDSRTQLYRRISTIWHVTPKDISVYKLNELCLNQIATDLSEDIAKLYDCVGTGIPNPVPAYLETLGESSKTHELENIRDFFNDVNGSGAPNVNVNPTVESKPIEDDFDASEFEEIKLYDDEIDFDKLPPVESKPATTRPATRTEVFEHTRQLSFPNLK